MDISTTASEDVKTGDGLFSSFYPIAARLFDVGVSGLLLLLSLPVQLLVALGVFLTSGAPVVFRQKRLGLNGAEFVLYKFRTMLHGAWDGHHQDMIKDQLFTQHNRRRRKKPFSGPEKRVTHHKPIPDDRLTPIGRFLRTTSLDELPQLFNVLKGDMSIVGPRPLARYEYGHINGRQALRLGVKPGLTGLWQVSGRSHLNYREMLQLDLEYVRRRSLWLDFKILLKTPRALFRGG